MVTVIKWFCSKAPSLLQENQNPVAHHLEHSSTGICISVLYSTYLHLYKNCLLCRQSCKISLGKNDFDSFRSRRGRATLIVRSLLKCLKLGNKKQNLKQTESHNSSECSHPTLLTAFPLTLYSLGTVVRFSTPSASYSSMRALMIIMFDQVNREPTPMSHLSFSSMRLVQPSDTF